MITNISYYIEFDDDQTHSDNKIFDIVSKAIRTTNHTLKNKLRLKYLKPNPYVVRDTDEENIQLMELKLNNKKSPSNVDNLLMIGIVKIKGYNKVLTINGESEDTNKFLNNCIDEMTLNFLKRFGEFTNRISISKAGLMAILKKEDENQIILYDRYLKK